MDSILYQKQTHQHVDGSVNHFAYSFFNMYVHSSVWLLLITRKYKKYEYHDECIMFQCSFLFLKKVITYHRYMQVHASLHSPMTTCKMSSILHSVVNIFSSAFFSLSSMQVFVVEGEN